MYKIVFPNGKVFELEMEEMIELLAALRDSTEGNECWEPAKRKALKMLDYMGPCDY